MRVAFMRAMRAKCTIDGIHFRNSGARFPSVSIAVKVLARCKSQVEWHGNQAQAANAVTPII